LTAFSYHSTEILQHLSDRQWASNKCITARPLVGSVQFSYVALYAYTRLNVPVILSFETVIFYLSFSIIQANCFPVGYSINDARAKIRLYVVVKICMHEK